MNATNTNGTYLATGSEIWSTFEGKMLRLEVEELVEGTIAYDMLDPADFSEDDLRNIAGGPIYNLNAFQMDRVFAQAWNEVIRSASKALQIRMGFRIAPGPRTSRPDRPGQLHGSRRP